MFQLIAENKSEVVAVSIITVITAMLCAIAVKIVQNVGLERVREVVYKGFVDAENSFQHGDNDAKFEYVVNIAQQALPLPFSLFITESLLRRVIQLWFDLIKDLLDNGKFDLSAKDGGANEY